MYLSRAKGGILGMYGQQEFVVDPSGCSIPIDSVLSEQHVLREKLQTLRELEAAERRESAERIKRNNKEASVMLEEFVAQENSRRKIANENNITEKLRRLQHATIAGFSRVDPCLPQPSEYVQRCLLRERRPEHPIDVYQRSVQETMRFRMESNASK